jgi:hypothetical protein
VTFGPNGQWFDSLPSCEAQVPCGEGRHPVRWEAGSLLLPEHPDVEGELVLAALGGEKAGCVELAEAWQRHVADLSVLAIGPRPAADEIVIGWDDVLAARPGPVGLPGSLGPPGPAVAPGPGGLAQHGPMRRPGARPASMAAVTARRQQMQQEIERVQRRRNDMLSLLALGYGFQVRLAGQVAAAYAEGPAAEGPTAGGPGTGGRLAETRPALVAAINGRLAPVAEGWLGIDPGQVVVSLHSGPGWGSVELTGRGEERRLRVSLPTGWLARVWACGLALTGRHLVVAVRRAGWPDARVLALRAPGAEPMELDVHGGAGPGDAPQWEVRGA